MDATIINTHKKVTEITGITVPTGINESNALNARLLILITW